MRSLTVLALCLGLFAVVQAAVPTQYGSVLLEGAIADEDTPATGPGSSNVLGGHHRRWKRHHKRHDHNDDGSHHHHHDDEEDESPSYWEERHSSKIKLLRCAQRAVSHFDINVAATWKPAGKALAECLLEHLQHCHDAPGLPEDFTKTVPWVMFMHGLDVLTAEGNDGLLHVTTVAEFYLAGGYKYDPITGKLNPWYTGKDSCASALVTLLHSGCNYAELNKDQEMIWSMARMVVKLLEQGLETNVEGELEKCLPDIPAVIIALTSTYCPATGQLFNPLNATVIKCTPAPNAPLYEDGAGALLGGSIISLLLLSGNQKLAALGVQVAFAANRQALAATQTTSFAGCLNAAGAADPTKVLPATYDGQLVQALAKIPQYSGGVAGQQASTPLPLGPDGQRVLCSAIAMVSGGYGPATWQNNLLWQGNADLTNAIDKTILTGTTANPPTVVISPAQVQGLCAAKKAIYSFTTTKPAGSSQVAVTVPAILPPGANEVFYSCLTSDAACASLPSWLTTEAKLAKGHTLGAGSYAAIVCQWK